MANLSPHDTTRNLTLNENNHILTPSEALATEDTVIENAEFTATHAPQIQRTSADKRTQDDEDQQATPLTARSAENGPLSRAQNNGKDEADSILPGYANIFISNPPSSNLLPAVDLGDRKAITYIKLSRLFMPGRRLGHESSDLDFSDFKTHVPKVKNGFEQTNFAALLFAYEQKRLGNLSIDILGNEIIKDRIQYCLDDVISFIVSFVDSSKYVEALQIIGIDLETELKAVKAFRAPENYIEQDAVLIFPQDQDATTLLEMQFGRNENIHLIRILKMFRILPSELKRRSELDTKAPDFINMQWLNQAFIDLYNKIEAADLTETKLRFDEGHVTALPRNIDRLRALTDLLLPCHLLTALPPEIGKLKALTWLTLFECQLITLPPEIGKLTALTRLYLHDNQLTTLPPEIRKLKALIRLYLHDNQLTSLPPEIGKLKALKELRLARNKLPQEAQEEIIALFADQTPNCRISF